MLRLMLFINIKYQNLFLVYQSRTPEQFHDEYKFIMGFMNILQDLTLMLMMESLSTIFLFPLLIKVTMA